MDAFNVVIFNLLYKPVIDLPINLMAYPSVHSFIQLSYTYMKGYDELAHF